MDETAVMDEVEETFELPEPTNRDEIQEFMLEMRQHKEKRGVTTLLNHLGSYLKLSGQALAHYEKAQKNLATVNGVRTENQRQGDARIGVKKTAYNFFKRMNSKQLQEQCKTFKVSAQYLESDEEIIKALVNRYVELQEEGEE